VGSDSVYTVIREVFTRIDSDWAWDAKPAPPGLRFLWVIWLVWILLLLAVRPVKDRLFHGLLIAAWLPFAFIHTLVAAAIMIVGQGISAILGMSILASGRRHPMDKSGKRRLFANLAPFLLSMSFLISLDARMLFPLAVSVLVLFMLTIYRDPVSGILEKGRMHQKPPFRVILDETLRVQAVRLGIWAVVPLFIMMILVFFFPLHVGYHEDYHLVFSTDPLQGSTPLDSASLIRSHIAYQEAITWGRLGEASWMTDSYTRPFRFEVVDNRIVRGEADEENHVNGLQVSNERDRELKNLLDHTKGGTPIVVQGTDIPRNSTSQLDSLGVVFYIMALVPFFIPGLQRVGRSRRRIITSYLNRQVA
jgi:hypothetical protein